VPEVITPVGVDQRLTKRLQKSNWDRKYPWDLKSFDTSFGIWKAPVHVQVYTYAQERLEKALICHLWLTLRIYTNKKKRLRQSCKLRIRA